MRPSLHDPAAVEHHDLVAVADRAQPVRDDQAGAAARAQALVDLPLDERVERAGRLVEHQQRRVAGERAGDLQPLPLTAAPVAPALLDHAVVAARARGRCRRGWPRPVQRRRSTPRAGSRSHSASVVADGPLEQDDVLVDERSDAARIARGISSRGPPSSRISPLPRPVQTGRRAARPSTCRCRRAADQGDAIPGPQRQRESSTKGGASGL